MYINYGQINRLPLSLLQYKITQILFSLFIFIASLFPSRVHTFCKKKFISLFDFVKKYLPSKFPFPALTIYSSVPVLQTDYINLLIRSIFVHINGAPLILFQLHMRQKW